MKISIFYSDAQYQKSIDAIESDCATMFTIQSELNKYWRLIMDDGSDGGFIAAKFKPFSESGPNRKKEIKQAKYAKIIRSFQTMRQKISQNPHDWSDLTMEVCLNV